MCGFLFLKVFFLKRKDFFRLLFFIMLKEARKKVFVILQFCHFEKMPLLDKEKENATVVQSNYTLLPLNAYDKKK